MRGSGPSILRSAHVVTESDDPTLPNDVPILDYLAANTAAVLDALGITPGGGTASTDEDLSSQCNGSRTNFTLSQSPVSGSVRLYWNGQRLIRNVHFTVSGSTISVVGFTPAAGQGLEAEYLPA